MSFKTSIGQIVDLDSVEAWTLRPTKRLPGADDPDWRIFPFRVEVDIGNGDTQLLFGEEARAFVIAQVTGLAPWLR